MNSSTNDFAQSSSLTGKRINGYFIEEIIGMGGFADVYSARRDVSQSESTLNAATELLDRRSNTTFAIKVLRKGISSPEMIARFEVERRLLEQFTNEGIVRVFESGLAEDNRPYFVMEQIDGLPITEFCEVEQLSLLQRLELFARVCDAVYHAHSKGIIHRDLKPSNVLVRLDEGVAKAKVIDFGIAKAIETPDWESMPVTQVNVVMGTPAYISPEQADGSGNADMRSDIYSLGVLLYEVVADQPPWSREQWRHLPSVQWSRFLRENSPPVPSQVLMQQANKAALAKQVQGDVDQIIRKAMSANPSDRYASACEMADDIRRWLEGRPVHARPLNHLEQLRRFVNRHRWQAATALATLVGIVSIAILGSVLSVTMRRSNRVLLIERNKAVELERQGSVARAEAISEKKLAEHQRYASEIRLSEVYLQNEEPFLAAERLRRTQADLRGWEFNYLTGLSKRYQSACDFDLKDAITFGSDDVGKWIAVASRSRWQLANLDTNQKLDVVDEKEIVVKIRVRANNDRVYVAALIDGPSKTAVRVYSVELNQGTGRAAPIKFEWETSVTADGCWIHWHEDQNGIYLLTVYGNGQEPSPSRILVFDAASGKTIKDRDYERFKINGNGIECKPNFPWILVRRSFSSFDIMSWPDLSRAKTVDLETNSMIGDFLIDAERKRILFAQLNQVYEIQISEDGQISEPTTVPEALSEELIYRLNLIPPSKKDASSENTDAGAKWVAISDQSQLIEGDSSVHPLMSKQEILQFSLKDGSYASLLAEGRVEVRSDLPLETSEPPDEAEVLEDPAAKAASELSEGRRVCVSPDSKFCVFQEWHRASFVRASLSSRNDKSTLAIYKSEPQRELEWTLLPVFHPDGSVLACVDGKLKALRFDESPEAEYSIVPLQNAPATEWNIDGKTVWSAAFNADGSRVFIGAKDGVSCYDWKSQELIHQWPVDKGPFHVMASTDDDTCFALRGDHTLFRLGKKPHETVIVANLPGPTPTMATFCPATQQLAIGVAGGVALFQLSVDNDPKLICNFACPEGATAIAMDDRGQRIAIASSNRRITVWDVSHQLELVTLPVRAHCSSIAFSADNRFLINTDFSPSLSVNGQ